MKTLIDRLKEKRYAIKVEELAELLSMSRQQIYKMVAADRVPHIRIGGSVRFDPGVTAEWLESRCVTSFQQSKRRPTFTSRERPPQD